MYFFLFVGKQFLFCFIFFMQARQARLNMECVIEHGCCNTALPLYSVKLASQGVRAAQKWCVCPTDICSKNIKQASLLFIFLHEVGHKVSMFFLITYLYTGNDLVTASLATLYPTGLPLWGLDHPLGLYFASTSCWLLSTFIHCKAYYSLQMLTYQYYTNSIKKFKFHSVLLDPKTESTTSHNPKIRTLTVLFCL